MSNVAIFLLFLYIPLQLPSSHSNKHGENGLCKKDESESGLKMCNSLQNAQHSFCKTEMCANTFPLTRDCFIQASFRVP